MDAEQARRQRGCGAPLAPARAEVGGAGKLALQEVDRVGGRKSAREPRQWSVGQKLHLQRIEFLGQLLELVLGASPIFALEVKNAVFRHFAFRLRIERSVKDACDP